jgi:hypothetical protein
MSDAARVLPQGWLSYLRNRVISPDERLVCSRRWLWCRLWNRLVFLGFYAGVDMDSSSLYRLQAYQHRRSDYSIFLCRRYPRLITASIEFTSASRSVKPGLIAAGIVSAWTCVFPRNNLLSI